MASPHSGGRPFYENTNSPADRVVVPSSSADRLVRRTYIVWYPDPSVQAHARTRITACACGKEGSGEMDGLRKGKSWNVKTGARMQLVRIMSVR